MNRAHGVGGVFTIALHVAVLAALVAHEPSRTALLAAAPVMVSLITPPKIEPPKPKVEVPPKPRPVVMKPLPKPEPLPLITAPVEVPSPSPIVVPPPPPPPAPAPVVAAPVIAPPVVMTAPIFAADYLDNPAPAYPAPSRKAGEQGRVILRVLVNPGGTADEVQVRTSSGFLRLDEAARDSVRRWRFVPAKRGGEPVTAWVLVPVSFRLDG